jgi:hypothetical protein
MDWCEENAVQYVFGLSKNETLDALVFAKADEVHTRRAIGNLDVVREYPLRRHQHRALRRGIALQRHLLRTRPGGDSSAVMQASDFANRPPHTGEAAWLTVGVKFQNRLPRLEFFTKPWPKAGDNVLQHQHFRHPRQPLSWMYI